MRRSIAFVLVPFFGALTACPIYGSDYCSQDPNCQVNQADATTDSAYSCSGYYYGSCPSSESCTGSYGDYYCAYNDSCSGSNYGTCASGSCAWDYTTSSYYCASTIVDAGQDTAPSCVGSSYGSCPAGQLCQYSNYNLAYSCDGGTATCSATCITGYSCGITSNGVYACLSTSTNKCIADSDCTSLTGSGSQCLSGVCTPPADQCTDSTQCTSTRSCVSGACMATCASGTCATGYTCDSTANPPVCKAAATSCTSSASCTSGSTCVNGLCVTTANANGSCATGLVSVNGGCVLDDKPDGFACTTTGVQDACQAGSICVRHECHIQCSALEAGGDAGTIACDTPAFPVCRATSLSRIYVCGPSTAGTQCDPVNVPACPNSWQVCVNGSCD